MPLVFAKQTAKFFGLFLGLLVAFFLLGVFLNESLTFLGDLAREDDTPKSSKSGEPWQNDIRFAVVDRPNGVNIEVTKNLLLEFKKVARKKVISTSFEKANFFIVFRENLNEELIDQYIALTLGLTSSEHLNRREFHYLPGVRAKSCKAAVVSTEKGKQTGYIFIDPLLKIHTEVAKCLCFSIPALMGLSQSDPNFEMAQYVETGDGFCRFSKDGKKYLRNLFNA